MRNARMLKLAAGQKAVHRAGQVVTVGDEKEAELSPEEARQFLDAGALEWVDEADLERRPASEAATEKRPARKRRGAKR